MARITQPPINCSVQDNDQVFLTVTIGDGATGSSFISKNVDGRSILGPITNFFVGSGKDIRGKNMVIVSTMPNVNPVANFVSVNYHVNGQLHRRSAPVNDSFITFETKINFV
jgi:hypothetical protein